MNEKQLEIFHSTIRFLENKEWDDDGDLSWFENDLWEDPEIAMVYDNGNK